GSDAGNPLPPVVTQPIPTPVPVESTHPEVTSPTAVPTAVATATITLLPTTTVEKTPAPIPESALKARIQDAKNKLDQLKNSDQADTMILSVNEGICEIKRSRELGYLIDVNSGEMSFVKGDYGSIALDLFRQNMTYGHTYIVLHTHAKDWYTCRGSGIISLNTFSLADLAVASNLTKQGYHVQKVIAVSDKDYEVYPKVKDDWKTLAEVFEGVDHLEQRMEIKFSTYDPYLDRTFYDVDNLMPLLTRELNYTYTVNNVILT
ncbi:MAG: hypothetical protein Q8R70_06200, partial [Methanoregula sp.]|nr:hypothetical protein [Methanoregula sp.]